MIAAGLGASASADSRWVTWGGSFQVPPPPAGTTYLDFDIHLHIVALLSDGTVQAWGDNTWGQCDVPTPPAGTHYVEVETGDDGTIALRSDGSIVIWGYCGYAPCGEYAPPAGTAFVDVDAAGCYFGRLSDGSVVTFGGCSPGAPPALPAGVSYVEITSACSSHALARCSDGTVVAWGANDVGQCDVPALPPGTSYVEIEAGCTQSVLRRSDGAVLAFGDSYSGQLNVPTLRPGEVFGSISTNGPLTIARVDPVPACGSVATTCWPPAANSAGPGGARFEIAGCPGITANDLVFTVGGLPPNKFGLFFYGSQPKLFVYGNGWTCIGGSTRRVRPGLVSDANGDVAFAVDLTQFPFSGSAQAIQPGSAWNFQYWYRDTAGSPSTFNFSDARNVVFSP